VSETGSRFCQKVYKKSNRFQDFRSRRGLQEPSPLRSRQVVFRMALLNLRVHNVSVTYAKDWRMAVLKYTRSPADSTIKIDMKNIRASADPSTTADSDSTCSTCSTVPSPPARTIDRPTSPDHLFQPSWVGTELAPDQIAQHITPRLFAHCSPFFAQRL
jgi:hypothetical protein